MFFRIMASYNTDAQKERLELPEGPADSPHTRHPTYTIGPQALLGPAGTTEVSDWVIGLGAPKDLELPTLAEAEEKSGEHTEPASKI